MPRHDPIPSSPTRRQDAWVRFKKLMWWMLGIAVIAIILALLYLKQSGAPMPLPMVLATIAGVGLSVLLGTALMGLVFLSNSSGHDEEAAGGDNFE